MLGKGVLLARLGAYIVALYADAIRHQGRKPIAQLPKSDGSKDDVKNIVVVGASFAGYHAARLILSSLPADGPYRVVIIEPNTHFQFTWTLPRFCVIEGHEHKTFIPYGPYLPPGSEDRVRWIHKRVATVKSDVISLVDSDEEIPYEYLVIATGSGATDKLPSRVGAATKASGVEFLQGMQQRIKKSERIVVVGGGAAGVELATDAKAQYPDKQIVLVHSRAALMHRFGPELQAAAMKGCKKLGVEVVLGERTTGREIGEDGTVTLQSGRKLECDLLINCTGTKPSSQILAELSPKAIAETGHIKVKPTLQVDDDALPKVYVCGDVAATGVRNPNSRTAMRQGSIVADNIILALQGRPAKKFSPLWVEDVIKLTLGLVPSVTHFGDDKNELLFWGKEKDVTLMIEQTWKHMGAKPYEDNETESRVASEPVSDKLREVANEIA